MFDRLNDWYDRLPPTRRFLTFMGAMAAAILPMQVGFALMHKPSALLGLALFAFMSIWGIMRAFSFNKLVHNVMGWLMVCGFFLIALGIWLM